MHRRRRQILILVAILIAVAAAVALLGPAPASASPVATLDWEPCPDGEGEPEGEGLPGGEGTPGMECASLEVPVDAEHPAGRQITLALGRLPADGPEPAAGWVLVNFGGPGPSGIDLLQRSAASFAGLRRQMHIVTWDPRGYGGLFAGRSTPLRCDWTAMVRPRTPPFPTDQAEFDQLAAANHAIAQPCRDTDPELFDRMDSASHAHDMDAIRAALGEPKLNFYGASYGGIFGQAYARLFPERIRTMVLDGTANHSTGDWDAELDAIAGDHEAFFQRFVDWCDTEPACVLHGSDVPGRWQELIARADELPLPAAAAGVRYTGRELRSLASGNLRQGPQGWAVLARAIRTAEQGDASGFVPPSEGRSPYPMVGTPGVTECLEYPRFTDHAHVAATVERIRGIAPNTGAAFPLVAHLPTCSGWPAPVRNPPAPVPGGVPPLLGAGTWSDFPGTNRVVEQVPGSVTIFHDGPGHVLYATGNACAIRHIDRYLTTTKLPPRGTECP